MLWTLLFKVSKGAKIRNRYNQVPHLTQEKVKITVTQNKCMTLRAPGCIHTKFGVPTSYNISDMLQTNFFFGTRPEVKITMIQKQYITLPNNKIYPHTNVKNFIRYTLDTII